MTPELSEIKLNRIPKALFASILIMLFPVILCCTLFNLKGLLTPLLSIAYVFQVLIILTTCASKNTTLEYWIVCVAIGLVTIALITLEIDAVKGWEVEPKDYINAFAKAFNFLLLFGVMHNIKTVSQKQIQLFMRCITVFALIACLYNFISNGSQIVRLRTITTSYQLNMKSFFANRNQFASFLFLSVVAHSYLCCNKKLRLHNYLLFAVQLLCVVLTMSRGGMLACFLFFALLFFQHLKNPKVTIGMSAVCILLAILLLSSDGLLTFISQNLIRADAKTAGRSEIWTMGLRIASNNIISGVGYYTGLARAVNSGFQFDQFHSLYIDSLVSGGIIELILILSLLIYIFVRCSSRCPDNEYKKIYISSMAAMLSLGFFESISFFSIGYTDTIYTIFFVAIPLLLANLNSPANAELQCQQGPTGGELLLKKN